MDLATKKLRKSLLSLFALMLTALTALLLAPLLLTAVALYGAADPLLLMAVGMAVVAPVFIVQAGGDLRSLLLLFIGPAALVGLGLLYGAVP